MGKVLIYSDFREIYSGGVSFIGELLKIPSIDYVNLEDVLKLVKILKPKRTILTNLHSDFDYNNLKKILPNNIIPAFDGMTLTL